MIYNATLVSYTTPKVSDGRGDYFGGVTSPASGRCSVQSPSAEIVGRGVDRVADVVAVMYAPPTLAVALEGCVAYRLDNFSVDDLLQVARVRTWNHGSQSHAELLLRTVR